MKSAIFPLGITFLSVLFFRDHHLESGFTFLQSVNENNRKRICMVRADKFPNPENILDILSILIWVQTVCRGYQQTTKIVASMEKVNGKLSIRKSLS